MSEASMFVVDFLKKQNGLTEFGKTLDPEDFYYSEEGYIIFTEKYHLKRGYCCQSGCKHCPYGFDKKTGGFKEK